LLRTPFDVIVFPAGPGRKAIILLSKLYHAISKRKTFIFHKSRGEKPGISWISVNFAQDGEQKSSNPVEKPDSPPGRIRAGCHDAFWFSPSSLL
jgi:hypothetical protein